MKALTGEDSYFEDFTPGRVMRHGRGKTMEPLENVLLTNLTMNTAQIHFNKDAMKDTPHGRRVCYGGATLSIVLGLASQDCAENALEETGMDKLRFKAPVFHGDTLYAYSEVVSADSSERADAGEVRFRHWGVNQEGVVVFEGERRALIKRRSHWAEGGKE